MSFAHTAAAIWQDDLNSVETLTLAVISDFADVATGVAFPSQVTIARGVKKSVRSVQRAIRSLIAKGKLTSERRGRSRRRGNRYRVLVDIPIRMAKATLKTGERLATAVSRRLATAVSHDPTSGPTTLYTRKKKSMWRAFGALRQHPVDASYTPEAQPYDPEAQATLDKWATNDRKGKAV